MPRGVSSFWKALACQAMCQIIDAILLIPLVAIRDEANTLQLNCWM